MAVHHAGSGEVVDLRPLGEKLRDARTTAIVKSDTFEAVRLVVPAGREIAPHRVEGEITLFCLEGCVRLGLSDTELELSAGQWVYLDGGVTHSVKGIKDASLLLTIHFQSKMTASGN
jgi:quercetin dioxygenase-like cupin family protein